MRSMIVEVVLVVGGVLAVLRLVSAVSIPLIQDYQGFLMALILFYVPIAVLGRRGRRWRFMETSWRAAWCGFRHFWRWAWLIFPPFVVAAGLWFTGVLGGTFTGVAAAPGWEYGMYQLIVVAFPEEFFFRGYVQTALTDVWPNRWRLFGADLGPAWPVTAAIFALSHSVMAFAWWHSAIFFPALVFGYLRARTGGLVAPILFHASSNILLDWVLRSISQG